MSSLKGQALVETAIIAPIIIFIMVGVFEVGWALRGYLVLINADREAARFAARPAYLKYDDETYNNIVAHGIQAMSGQLSFTKTGTIIISVVRIDPQWPCDPSKRTQDAHIKCDCKEASTSPYSQTLIISPLTNPTSTFTYPYTSAKVSAIDFSDILNLKSHHVGSETDNFNLVELNRYMACQAMLNNYKPLIDTEVFVEMFYGQPQLVGFPIISNPFTDPVPMYASTTFRVVEEYR